MDITLAIAIRVLTASLLLLGSGLVLTFIALSDRDHGPQRARPDQATGHQNILPETAVELDRAA